MYYGLSFSLGGSASIAFGLANIIYNMDSFNVDASSLRTLDNAGSDGSSSDGEMYGSNHVWLNDIDQSINYPIFNTGGTGSSLTYYDTTLKRNVTLGNSVDGGSSEELVTNGDFSDGITGWINDIDVSVLNNEVQFENADNGKGVYSVGQSIPVGTNVIIQYECTSYTSGNHTVREPIDGRGTSNTGVGVFTLIGVTTSTGIKCISNSNGGTFTLDNYTIKEILPISTTYNQTNSHSNTFGLTKVRTEAELLSDNAYLDANPEAVAKLVDGETVAGLSFVLADIHNFYPGNEGSAETLGRVYDVTDQTFLTYATIVNFTTSCRTTLENTNYGASNLLYKQDVTGRWLSMADANTIEFTGDSRYVDAGFMPPSDNAWEIDFVIESFANQVFKFDGVFGLASAQYLMFGQSNQDGIYCYVGDQGAGATAIPLADGLHHMRIEFDGAGNGNFVVNNTDVYPYTGSNYTYSVAESFFIGGHSRDGVLYPATNLVTEPVKYFQYTERTRTSTQRDVDWAKAKALHPTLP